MYMEQLERDQEEAGSRKAAIQRAVEADRERCAKVAESMEYRWVMNDKHEGNNIACADIATAIKRGE